MLSLSPTANSGTWCLAGARQSLRRPLKAFTVNLQISSRALICKTELLGGRIFGDWGLFEDSRYVSPLDLSFNLLTYFISLELHNGL